MLEEIGARTEGENLAQATTLSAETELAHCQPAEPAAQALRDLTQQLLHRDM